MSMPGLPPRPASIQGSALAAFAVVLSSAAMPAEARRGCPDHVKEIKRLYAARDPGLLAVDILEPGCTPRELYQAAYYQGFGFYFVGRHKDALANLLLARSLTGPWDEQILEYIWTIQGKIGDSEGQARTLEEFREVYPESRKLAEMESAEKRAVKTSFDGLATGGLSWLAGDRSYQGLRGQGILGGSWTQTRSGHSLSEYLNLSGGSSLEGRDQRHHGLEGGLLYRGRAFSAQAEAGRLRSVYPALVEGEGAAGDTGAADPLRLKARGVWEWVWTGSLAYAFKRPGGWTWTADLTHFVLGESFSSYGVAWDMDRRVGLRTLSLEASAELQDFGDEGCVYIEQGPPRCNGTRYASFEAAWEMGRTAGRHILGAEVQGRHEVGIDSDAWRVLSTGGVSHGLRLSPGLKLTHVLDLGWDWRRESGSPLEDEPVLAARSSLAWFF